MKNRMILFLMYFLVSCSPGASDLSVEEITPTSIANPAMVTPMTLERAPLGKVLVYTPKALYVTNANGSGSPVLIYTIESPLPMVSLSLDGERLAYFQENYLYVMNVKTKQVTAINREVIGSIGGQLRWSPDEKELVLSCSTTEQPSPSICLIDLESGNIVILVGPQTAGGKCSSSYMLELEDWSRDGTKMIFACYAVTGKGQKQDFGVYIYDPHTKSIQEIFDSQKQDIIFQIRGVSISPDNKTILLSGIDANGAFQIFRIGQGESDFRQLTNDVGFSFTNPVWGPSPSAFFAHKEGIIAGAYEEYTVLLDLEGNLLSTMDVEGTVIGWVE